MANDSFDPPKGWLTRSATTAPGFWPELAYTWTSKEFGFGVPLTLSPWTSTSVIVHVWPPGTNKSSAVSAFTPSEARTYEATDSLRSLAIWSRRGLGVAAGAAGPLGPASAPGVT